MIAAPLALVFNPAATRTGDSLRAEAARVLGPLGLRWTLATRGRADAAALARRAAAEGARLVVALGGDGTAGEVAGALAGGPVAAVALPGGNANVFARALGWPAEPVASLRALAAALERPEARPVRLGRLVTEGGERVFAVTAGVGLDAETVEWIEARPAAKHRLRYVGYGIGTAWVAARAPRGPRLRVSPDGAEPLAAATLLAACGSPYTYLGRRPLDLVPGAAFDGRLAWTALLRVRPHEVTALLVRAARGRPLPVGGPALAGGLAEREVLVTAARPTAVQADGEALGRHAWVRILPGPELLTIAPPGLKSSTARPT